MAEALLIWNYVVRNIWSDWPFFLAGGAARVKLQRNGFDFIFFRQDFIRRGALSAEGRFIPMILLILSNFLLWNRFAPSSLKKPAPAKWGGGIQRGCFFRIPGFAGQASGARVESRRAIAAGSRSHRLSPIRVQGSGFSVQGSKVKRL